MIHSALDPAGPQAAHLAWMWDVTLWVCAIAYAATMAVLIFGLAGRRRHAEEKTLWKRIAAGTAATVAVLIGLTASSVLVGRATSELSTGGGLKINLTGYQWWWRAEYEHPDFDRRFTTANELHIPVGRPVMLSMTGADVIHSFWVPSLHGKRDLIPGERTTLWLRADKPGIYRGQCAEFCGYQHAHMGLRVIAEPAAAFDEWYANQVKPAAEPDTEERRRGREVFLASDCILCHTVRGTIAGGRAGPELTHLKSRATIAAATLPNTRGALGGWIADPQRVKAGVRMPPHSLAGGDLNALLGYLESLE
jgi:cytochrome c oxidase subunit 2